MMVDCLWLTQSAAGWSGHDHHDDCRQMTGGMFQARFQFRDRGRLRFGFSSDVLDSPMILSPFARLHARCASWRLSRSHGWPPLAIGIIWSTVADIGWGGFSVLSTGLPQIAHTSCVARMILRLTSYCCLNAFVFSLLFSLAIVPHTQRDGSTDPPLRNRKEMI